MDNNKHNYNNNINFHQSKQEHSTVRLRLNRDDILLASEWTVRRVSTPPQLSLSFESPLFSLLEWPAWRVVNKLRFIFIRVKSTAYCFNQPDRDHHKSLSPRGTQVWLARYNPSFCVYICVAVGRAQRSFPPLAFNPMKTSDSPANYFNFITNYMSIRNNC